MKNSIDNLIANAEYFSDELATMRKEATELARDDASNEIDKEKLGHMRKNLIAAEKLLTEISFLRD